MKRAYAGFVRLFVKRHRRINATRGACMFANCITGAVLKREIPLIALTC
jgi:hypothetical protein